MNLLMVRHGEIPSNVKKIYAGRSTEGLSPRGVRQAEEIAEKLKFCNAGYLYSSPVQRALQTAGIIGKKIGIAYHADSSFREMELGPWEGLSEEDIARLYPDEWRTWQESPAGLRLPGRETLEELLKRVLSGIERSCENGRGQNIIIVTHVAVIRVLLLWHANKSLDLYKTIHVPNAGIFEIRIDCNSPLHSLSNR